MSGARCVVKLTMNIKAFSSIYFLIQLIMFGDCLIINLFDKIHLYELQINKVNDHIKFLIKI